MKVNQKKIGVFMSYAGQMVHILTGLIYTPVMLRLLGQSEYGLYQLVYSVVSYLSLLSLGFGSSYMRFYSRERAKKNDDGIAELNGMFMIVFIIIAIISIICGYIMIVNINQIFGKGLSDKEYSTARVLMGLMVVNLALTFPNSVFNCIITSQEKFFFQKTIIFFQYLLNPFLTLPLLLRGYGSIGMVVITTFLTFSVLIGNAYYCISKLDAKFKFNGLKFELLKEMGIFTFFIFLNQIIDQINLSVDKFLLGRIIGTTAVAIYGVGGQINALFMQLSSSISNVFIPKVNRIVAEGNDSAELSILFLKVGRIQFLLLLLILSCFAFYGESFIMLWAGKGYNDSYWVAFILMVPATVPLIQNLGIEIQRAKNKHRARSLVYFAIAVVNVLGSIPLIYYFGPIGAALGTAISLIAGTIIFMNWYYFKYLDIDIPGFWRSISGIMTGFIIPFIFGMVTFRLFDLSRITNFLCITLIYTIVYCISMYHFGMVEDEKQMITSLKNRIIKKG